MCEYSNTDSRAAQSDQVINDLVRNSGLVGRHVEELYKLIRVQDEVMASYEDKLRRLFELITPRFNDYFQSEGEARMAWPLFAILRRTPNAPFPGDAPDRNRPAANFLSREVA